MEFFGSNIKKFIILSQKEVFLIFPEIEKLLIFPEMELASFNINKYLYFLKGKPFLYFQK